MKKKLFALILVLLLAAFSFSACSLIPGRDAKEETSEKEEKTEKKNKKSSGNKKKKKTKKDQTKEQEEKKEEAPEEQQDEADEKQEDSSSDLPDVEGNGGFFLRVGDGVYYHCADGDFYGETILGRDLLYDTGVREDLATLCRYDIKSGEVTELARDGCTGKMYLCGDKIFYTRDMGADGMEVWYVTLDGSEQSKFCPGEVVGVSPEGDRLAIDGYYDGSKFLMSYDENMDYLCSIPVFSDPVRFCGFCGGELFYLEQEEGKVSLYSGKNDMANHFFYGELSLPGGFGGPYCDRFVTDGNRVCMLLAWYGGPVNTMEDFLVVEMEAGKEDSLSEIQHGYDAGLMPDIDSYEEPYLYLADDGIRYEKHERGTAYLSESTYGSLMAFTESGDDELITDDAIREDESDRLVFQNGIVIGDAVYLMVAGAERMPGEDYKIFPAFRLLQMYPMRLDFSDRDTFEQLLQD